MSASDRSDTGSTSSSDESEDVRLTGLVATRAKRKSAGNKYEATLGEYDDPELQALFAEEDGESDEYESSEPDDDEAAMDSSSSDEDAGPPKEGDTEDLEGEKELKRAERAEQNRKRKAQQARLTVPAFAKKVKRVKLAEAVHADDGGSSAIDIPLTVKKKKDDRKNLRLSGDDLPTRQSTRTSAVAFRETVSVSLQESAERSRKHKTALQETMKRERAARRTDLTPEERLEKCKSIEKETAKELGRFEREEAERVRLREEALMAKRRRAVEGPLVRTFSTSALYENGKVRVDRLQHGSQPLQDILVEHEIHDIHLESHHLNELPVIVTSSQPEQPHDPDPLLDQAESLDVRHDQTNEEIQHNTDTKPSSDNDPHQHATARDDKDEDTTITTQIPADDTDPVVLADEPAISQETTAVKLESGDNPALPDAGPANDDSKQSFARTAASVDVHTESPPLQGNVEQRDGSPSPLAIPATAPVSTEPSSTEIQTFAPVTVNNPTPVVREQAQRLVISLEDFPSLEGTTVRRSKAASGLEPTPVAQLLMPDSYPSFTDEETSYLRKTRKLKQELHPKQLCALTSWEGKYRDPNTGIVFADVAAYKMLQRLIAGGCRWNSMLECWSAPYVGMIGRPAAGVPDGFDQPAAGSG